MDKKEWILFFACLIAAGLSSAGLLSQRCAYIQDNTLRLHILANSDTDEDQRVKLAVRDAVIGQCEKLFADCRSRDEVLREAGAHLGRLEATAAEVLIGHGLAPTVTAELTEMYFSPRVYGDRLLPAGVYTALRLRLGEGEGKNWWCVLYPPLCLQSAAEPTDETVLTQNAILQAQDGQRFRLRLAVADWLQKLLEPSRQRNPQTDEERR